jgi:stage V sporulation protein R
VRPLEGGLNPYHLGLKIWEDIRRRFDDPSPEEAREFHRARGGGVKQLFDVRSADRDTSFLRRFLTEELMREMDLFQYQSKGNDLVVSEVSDQDGWKKIKETLIKNVGMGGVPVIKIEDSGYGDDRALYLKHDHDGRDLHLEYAERTLAYLFRLWAREVALETAVGGKRTLLVFNDQGMSTKSLKT